uniref:Complement receptor type 1-like n=1 Tax=Acanthochromis polyacanthus TaxID=80966 RepID=A0A3Q1ETE5_9TELE
MYYCRLQKTIPFNVTSSEGETTCSTPAVTNSVERAVVVSEYRVGETVSFTCQQGFSLDGAQQIKCGSDGQWQPEPPKCGCGVPQNVQNSNANLADKYITMTSFPSGDKVYYTCDVGYTPVGGSKVRFCRNGKWTPLRLKSVDCDVPPVVKNAEIKGPHEPPYTYRTAIRYHCRVGTLIGQKEIWCTENGTWSTPPACHGSSNSNSWTHQLHHRLSPSIKVWTVTIYSATVAPSQTDRPKIRLLK